MVSKRKSKIKIKDSRWKRAQKRFRLRRWMRRLMALVLVLALAGAGIGFWKVLRALRAPPAQLPLTKLSAPDWDGRSQLNLLVQTGDDWFLLALEPRREELNLIHLTGQTPLPTSRGEYDLGDLFALARAQNPPQGFEFVISEVENWAGVVLDGYVVKLKTQSSKLKTKEGVREILGEANSYQFFLNLPVVWGEVSQNLATNLNRSQLIRLLLSAGKFRDDRIGFFSVDCGNGVKECQEVLQGAVEEGFVEKEIAAEGLKVQILNGSGVPGLARRAAAVFTNMGMDVIDVGNTRDESAAGRGPALIRVYGDFGETRTVARIEQVVGVKAEVNKNSPPQRADVVVTLFETAD